MSHGEELRLRMVKLAAKVMRGEPVTHRFITETFGVSKATANRDLRTLIDYLPVSVDVHPLQGGLKRYTVRLAEAA